MLERERWRVSKMRHCALPLVIALDADDALVYVGLHLDQEARHANLEAFARRHDAVLEPESRPSTAAAAQLREYLDGQRRDFDLPLRLLGTSFQQRAWAALREIPHGQTRSYGQQAAQMQQPGAARAVGHANGENPVAIVVPCHRVVGADGRLTGFGGGIEAKRWLLELERRRAPPSWSPRPGPRRPDPQEAQLGLFS